MRPNPERAAPAIAWPGVLAGAALATLVGLLAGGLVLAALGVAAGGFLAGRVAGASGLFQGAVTAILTIVIGSVLGSLGPGAPVDLVIDTAATIGRDVILLAAGAAGGWLATRS